MSNFCSPNIKQNPLGNVKSSHFALTAHESRGKGFAIESHPASNCRGGRRGLFLPALALATLSPHYDATSRGFLSITSFLPATEDK